MAPVSFLMLASCGSYQYSGYENDGIYGNTNGTDARIAKENRKVVEM